MTILTSGPDTQGCSRTGVALYSIHIFLLYKVILKIYQLVVLFKKECSLLSYFDFMTISVRIDIIYHDDFMALIRKKTQCYPLILTKVK